MALSTDAVPKITLHWLEASRSHRILWLLEELKIPYELKTYKGGADRFADPKLREIHPLGKSPVITIEVPGAERPVVIAESAAIVEYLCDYYGKWLIPERYPEGKEGKVGCETESWLRYRYYMHYAEGGFAPLLVTTLLVHSIRNAPVPFFIKPITRGLAGKIESMYLRPNFQTHYKFLEEQLKTSPNGGKFLCGDKLSSADILMVFPLEAGKVLSVIPEEERTNATAYVQMLLSREAYKRSIEKIEQVEGSFKMQI